MQVPPSGWPSVATGVSGMMPVTLLGLNAGFGLRPGFGLTPGAGPAAVALGAPLITGLKESLAIWDASSCLARNSSRAGKLSAFSALKLPPIEIVHLPAT